MKESLETRNESSEPSDPQFENEIREGLIQRVERLEEKNAKLAEENEQLKRDNEVLRESAVKDPLTKLYNRHGFNEEINRIVKERNIESERRKSKIRQNTLLLLDIDNFKLINDTYGHDIGDEVLRQAAEFLRQSTRETDIICRWGGEEFVVVFRNVNEKQVLQKFYNKENKRAQIGFVAIINEKEIPITFSGGAAEIAQEEYIKEAIVNADKKLYQAKRDGRNMIYRQDEDHAEKQLH